MGSPLHRGLSVTCSIPIDIHIHIHPFSICICICVSIISSLQFWAHGGFCSSFFSVFLSGLIARRRSIFMLLLLLFLLLFCFAALPIAAPPLLILIGVWFISISLATLQMQKNVFFFFPAITISRGFSFSSSLGLCERARSFLLSALSLLSPALSVSHNQLLLAALPACCACVVVAVAPPTPFHPGNTPPPAAVVVVCWLPLRRLSRFAIVDF